MPIRDWFRPPRSLLTLYLAGAFVAVACLAWLAIRPLNQNAALDAQRTTDRLQGAANLAAARSLQALVELERSLVTGAPPSLSTTPAHTSVVRVHDAGVTVLSGTVPFVPRAPATTVVPDGVFDVAEQLEPTPAGRARAAAAYRALAASSSSPAVRAGALMRLARMLRQQGQHDEALNAYAALAQATDVVIEGRPADLIARLGRCAVLDALGRRDELTREAGSLRADLARGRWPITSALWASVFEDATRWVGAGGLAPAIAGLGDAVAAAGALERFWQQRQGAPTTGATRTVLDTPRGLALVIEQVHDGETRVLVAGPPHVESIRQQL